MGKKRHLLTWAIGVLIILYGGGVTLLNAETGIMEGTRDGINIVILGFAIVAINQIYGRWKLTPDW